MKYIYIVIAILIISISLTVKKEKKEEKKEKLKIITSFTIIADITSNIAGNKAEVNSITKVGAEIHDYQPTPKDIIKAQDSDIILYNGLGLERWFKRFLYDIKDTATYIVSKGIKPISIYEGHYRDKPNPHAWMSTDNALIYIKNIRDILIKLDPKNKETYIKNAQIYSQKIIKLKKKLNSILKDIPPKEKWIVSTEGAFSYLARDLSLKELYLWPINADQQGTPRQMKALIEKIKKFNIKTIFSESTISAQPAKSIAEQTGIIYSGILYVDSLSTKEGPVPSYLDLLKVTTNTIVNALKNNMEVDLVNDK